MKTKSITIRIDWKTYQNFRKRFKAYRGESASSYFERLYEYLEELYKLNFGDLIEWRSTQA